MIYDFERTRKRIKAIDGSFMTVSDALGISVQRLRKLVSGTYSPEISTMTRLNDTLKDLEEKQKAKNQQVVEQHPEIFLSC